MHADKGRCSKRQTANIEFIIVELEPIDTLLEISSCMNECCSIQNLMDFDGSQIPSLIEMVPLAAHCLSEVGLPYTISLNQVFSTTK
jgi:hypothetical protein